MANYVTQAELTEALREQTDEIVGIIDIFAQRIDDGFVRVETRLDSLESKYGHLADTLDAFMARMDTYETEQKIRDHQFEKLLTWDHKVSEKTGIPLDDL